MGCRGTAPASSAAIRVVRVAADFVDLLAWQEGVALVLEVVRLALQVRGVGARGRAAEVGAGEAGGLSRGASRAWAAFTFAPLTLLGRRRVSLEGNLGGADAPYSIACRALDGRHPGRLPFLSGCAAGRHCSQELGPHDQRTRPAYPRPITYFPSRRALQPTPPPDASASGARAAGGRWRRRAGRAARARGPSPAGVPARSPRAFRGPAPAAGPCPA